jgi:hypothetical protein
MSPLSPFLDSCILASKRHAHKLEEKDASSRQTRFLSCCVEIVDSSRLQTAPRIDAPLHVTVSVSEAFRLLRSIVAVNFYLNRISKSRPVDGALRDVCTQNAEPCVLKPKLIIFLIEVELARAKLKAKTDLFLNRIEFACGAASQESFCWVKNN